MNAIPKIALRLIGLIAMPIVSGCGKKPVHPACTTPMAAPAFWVWHRTSPLKPAEKESLENAGVHSLYWQAAECGWKDGRWNIVRISSPVAVTEDLEIIPVFRIKAEPAFLGSPDAARLLAEQIHQWSGTSPWPAEIQLDFDCPASLLVHYARFLKSLGAGIPPARVSITALASWPQSDGFRELALSVSSLAPMFYDLEADAAEDVAADRFHPMADPTMAKWIRLWADCPRPWLAGLPNFERLSLFGADGKLIGHLRGWEHDPVFFHPALKARSLAAGTTLFRADRTITLNGTEISPEMKLVHRTTDAEVIIKLLESCQQSGAGGVLYFSLPGPGIQVAFTPAHLAHIVDHKWTPPLFEIDNTGAVTLKNPGPCDIAAGRWELELRSDQVGAFRSASPGGFVETETAGGIPPELAGTVILRFSKLPIGQSITSGPIISKPEAITWKVRNALQK